MDDKNFFIKILLFTFRLPETSKYVSDFRRKYNQKVVLEDTKKFTSV